MNGKHDPLQELLRRSGRLEQSLVPLLELKTFDQADRTRCSKIMCSVAFEHAESAKLLIAAGNFTSALSVVRLQYEALVRAMWLLYAASDRAVEKLTSELTHESSKKADRLPLLGRMLQELDGKGPAEPMRMLFDFKEYSWKPLSSYVHGGIHAVHRHSKGYPLPLLAQAIRASNGVSMMVGMLLVILSGERGQSARILQTQVDFGDCLPPPKPRET